MDWMMNNIWVLWVPCLIAAIVLGIPFGRFLVNRVGLWVHLIFWSWRRDVFFAFRRIFSLFSLNMGKHADLLGAVGEEVYLIKLGGSFKRATKIYVSSPTRWLFKVYPRTPSISGALIMEPVTKERPIYFDLSEDCQDLRSELYAVTTVADYHPVYLLTPVPLSVYWGEKETEPLSNGDLFLGMRLCTVRYFFRYCLHKKDGCHKKSWAKEEQRLIRRAFHRL